MKFKLLKWSIRVWDLVVFLFLLGYFFLDGFRALFDSSPYLVKAMVWTGVVLFFYYSIISWYKIIKQSLINVVNSKEFKEAKTKEELSKLGDDVKEDGHCHFTTGPQEGVSKEEEK